MLRSNDTIRIPLAAVLMAGVAGCTVGPDYHPPRTVMPAEFAAIYAQTRPATRPTSTSGRMIDPARWWEYLDDSELDSLIERAVAASPDLEIAFSRLQEARAEESVINGGALPAADFSAGAGRGSGTDSARGRVGQPVYAGTNTGGLREITHIIGFDAGWELDLFGKFRREAEAARADTQAATEARNAVLIVLISDVSRAYMNVRALQLRLAIARDNVAIEQQSVDVLQTRFERGLTNELDLALARRELATVQAEVEPLMAARDSAERRVAVLLGRFPEDLKPELSAHSAGPQTGPAASPQARTVQSAAALPQLPDSIQPALPVELLRRRPDIRHAERQLAAETARIGVQTADLFPHVAVTAGAGLQGQGLGRTPNRTSFIWSAGPAAYWPLLDFGTLDALVTVQDLRTREALFNYKKVVIRAVEEVNDAISNYSAQQQRLGNLADALIASQRAVDLATERYGRGLTDFLNVLDAQRQFYILQDQFAQAQEAVALQFIALHQGLGGGWETFAPAGPPPSPRPAIIAAAARLLQSDSIGTPQPLIQPAVADGGTTRGR
jgi:NodT family efflux transporter outer membrane factor (OMF) lipoprotein